MEDEKLKKYKTSIEELDALADTAPRKVHGVKLA